MARNNSIIQPRFLAMHGATFTTIKQIGDAYVLEIPQSILDQMGLEVGSKINVSVEDGRLILQTAKKPRYSAQELMAMCNPNAPMPDDLIDWESMPSVGKELL